MITRTARVILGLLHQSPESIWDLKRTLRRRLSHIWTESDGQLYPAVKALLAEGMLTADAAQTRQRTALHITDAGRHAVDEWLSEDPPADTPRDELVLRISLMKDAASATTFRHLDHELQRSLQVAHVERALLGSPDRYTLLVPSFAANWLARRWVILLHEARAAWCREVITHLREIAHPDLNPLLQEPPAPPPRSPLEECLHLEAILEKVRRGEPLPEGWDTARSGSTA